MAKDKLNKNDAINRKFLSKSVFFSKIFENNKRMIKDSKKHNRTDAKGKEISYSYYQINLGRNDGVRPKELVEFLSKLTKIPNYCFGDIIIHNNKTSFEIRPDMNKKIVQIQGRKVNGFELSLRKLSKLE